VLRVSPLKYHVKDSFSRPHCFELKPMGSLDSWVPMSTYCGSHILDTTFNKGVPDIRTKSRDIIPEGRAIDHTPSRACVSGYETRHIMVGEPSKDLKNATFSSG
ncbi:hypothetical protein GOP47_0001140, partial [Adiantum capillus-veneris]